MISEEEAQNLMSRSFQEPHDSDPLANLLPEQRLIMAIFMRAYFDAIGEINLNRSNFTLREIKRTAINFLNNLYQTPLGTASEMSELLCGSDSFRRKLLEHVKNPKIFAGRGRNKRARCVARHQKIERPGLKSYYKKRKNAKNNGKNRYFGTRTLREK